MFACLTTLYLPPLSLAEANPEKLNNQFKNKFFYFKVCKLLRVLNIHSHSNMKLSGDSIYKLHPPIGWWERFSVEKVFVDDWSHHDMGKLKSVCIWMYIHVYIGAYTLILLTFCMTRMWFFFILPVWWWRVHLSDQGPSPWSNLLPQHPLLRSRHQSMGNPLIKRCN